MLWLNVYTVCIESAHTVTCYIKNVIFVGDVLFCLVVLCCGELGKLYAVCRDLYRTAALAFLLKCWVMNFMIGSVVYHVPVIM